MVSLSLRPSQLPLLLLLLLLPPPPSRGAEPLPEDHERIVQLDAIRSAILGPLGLSAPPKVRSPALSAAEVRRLQRRYAEAVAQLRTNRSLQATDSDRSSDPRSPKVGILTRKLELSQNTRNVLLRLPFLEQPHRKPRRARELKPDKTCEEGGVRRCCPRPQRVSFKELGWSDWVLEPREFEIRFCEGSCPKNYRPANMHAQLKARLHSVSPHVVGPPCCVPSAYEPMVLMHYDSDGNVALTPFDDLVPTACHCA